MSVNISRLLCQSWVFRSVSFAHSLCATFSKGVTIFVIMPCPTLLLTWITHARAGFLPDNILTELVFKSMSRTPYCFPDWRSSWCRHTIIYLLNRDTEILVLSDLFASHVQLFLLVLCNSIHLVRNFLCRIWWSRCTVRLLRFDHILFLALSISTDFQWTTDATGAHFQF